MNLELFALRTTPILIVKQKPNRDSSGFGGGGELSEDGNYFWFNPKLSYEHPNGGKNSTDFLWNGLWFDLQNNKWVTGHNILTLNSNF